MFANRARAVSDITATPLEFEGLDPSFQHFYNYPQGVQTLGSDIILTFDEGLYTDPFGQRTVTQPAPRTFPILVAVGPGGTFHELTDYMDLEDIFFGPFGRIFPK